MFRACHFQLYLQFNQAATPMTREQLTYLIFGIVLLFALIFDLGLLSQKSQTVSIKKALVQTIFWVLLSLGFAIFLWFEDGHEMALNYVSAYLMEWSLSIDNIFVFILIFSFFHVKEKYYARVLLIGILMAIVLRILFITAGVALVDRFHWVLYIFGAFLVYTGIKMFVARQEEEFSPEDNFIYKAMKRFLRLTDEESGGRFILYRHGKAYFTRLAVVIGVLAATDLIFALDSIPAVFAITQEALVVYTSNIFAVLGLRSLFFLLKGAVNRFDYLQQGIAVVLVFVGLKMLIEIWRISLPIYVSLIAIIVCLAGSILYSLYHKSKQNAGKVKEN